MKWKKSISDIRHDYGKFRLDEGSIESDPFEQFKIWFDEAVESKEFVDPNAVALATVNKEGMPDSRIVLLKQYTEDGFIFFTNYESQKGKELLENPQASMLFFWDKYERQIRINGTVEKISAEDSDLYFQTRPYASRVGAWASAQSEVLKSRFALMRKVAQLTLKYKTNVPLPPFWGGYILRPVKFEFWQGRESRLHDRFRFLLQEDSSWQIDRLSP